MLCGGDCQKERLKDCQKFQIIFLSSGSVKGSRKNFVYIYKLHNDAVKSCNILHTLMTKNLIYGMQQQKRECGESTQVQGKKQMTVLVFNNLVTPNTVRVNRFCHVTFLIVIQGLKSDLL